LSANTPVALFIVLALCLPAAAGDRVPGEHWMRYADPAEAGFDPERLEAARVAWEALPSSTFLVVADGAVVAAWGDVERRFMCHSVRKSFLSALYGIYWDRGEIELNKTLADLGIDDTPDPLLASEQQARILDLLKARSGVFHPAAYAGRTDSRPRGSEGPGRYFAYNNWDFNTLATILEQETGARVFEAFDEHFGRPLGMQDWLISDGYYHYERDKSQYPAYPFRMSARDAARFGLLFAREGLWGDTRILSRHWVRRSTALYSIDDDTIGYGFMWWVYREPRFARHGMYAASGVGKQLIAVLPEIDMVIVNRANTYEGEGTPRAALRDLIELVLEARTGAPVAHPKLLPMADGDPDPGITSIPAERLAEYVGTWSFPAPGLGIPELTTFEVSAAGDHLVAHSPTAGTFAVYLQADGSLYAEDSRRRLLAVRDENGALAGFADVRTVVQAALTAAAAGEPQRAEQVLALVAGDESVAVAVARAVVEGLAGHSEQALAALRELAGQSSDEVEGTVNWIGYGLLRTDQKQAANTVFELNTTLFPESFNTWDSLAEAQLELGHDEVAQRYYQRSLELNSNNRNAAAMIARLRDQGSEQGLDYPALMAAARIPGLTLAVIENNEVVRTELLGVADAESGAPVTAETMFEAASLSKPVFATIVLRLAERGQIDLDRPLLDYLPNPRIDHDPRAQALTARIVLSHRTGLPNWGDPDRLELRFYPGAGYGYSGEGYVYLQKVVESITGLDLDQLAHREVFTPLGMTHSRFSWSTEDELPLAMPHDHIGRRRPERSERTANAAASLYTTAADYARFVLAWMKAEIVSPATVRTAVSPVVGMKGNETHTWRPWEIRDRIAWGLGWGVQLPAPGDEESGPIAWQWGDNGPAKGFVAWRPQTGSGVVYFANGANGLAIGRALVAEHLDDMRPAFAWAGYEAHDAPGYGERLLAAEAEEDGRYLDAIAAYEKALPNDPEPKETRRLCGWLRELHEVTEHPLVLEEELLRSYAGSYGPRTITFRDGQLFYQREGRQEYRLVPLSEHLFAFDGMTGFRIEFAADQAGTPTHLVGHYLDGRQDQSPRDPEETGGD
jgi:CubicO group peptidase (beta-lactamase class C family)